MSLAAPTSSSSNALEGAQAAARAAGGSAAARRSNGSSSSNTGGGASGAASDFARLLQGRQWQADEELNLQQATAEPRSEPAAQDKDTDGDDSEAAGPDGSPGRRARAVLPEGADGQTAGWTPLARPLAGEAGSPASLAARDAALRAAGLTRGHRASPDTGREPGAGAADALGGEAVKGGQGPLVSQNPNEPAPAAERSVPGAAAAVGTASGLQDGSLPSLQADAAASSAPLTTPAEAPAAPVPGARATLEPTPGTPAFTEALGVQISTWLESGVQHAVLELHPAELGPIDVRIALRDGITQVDLAADVASTRSALAEALPQLAQALGDVGLNLGGGVVSDGSAGAGQAGAEDRRPPPGTASAASLMRAFGSGAGDEAGSTGRPAARPLAARGLLDLYA